VPLNKPDVFFSQRLNNKFFRGYPHPLPEVRPGVVLECGALDGKTNSIGWFFENNLGWTAYNIEPNPHSFMFCEMSRPNATNIEAALSNVKGTTTLEWPPETGHGSIAGIKFRGRTQTAEVQTITYCDFIQEYKVELIDLFVLDVEGHEMAVVEGMAGTEVWPRVICAETNKTSAEELGEALVGYTVGGKDAANTYFVRDA
jgi:FkbM family methyltransferase